MDLLKQCQQWFEQNEIQKVIDALEAIPAEERTPELDSELAKAYIAVAHIGEREPFEKALELLAPHEEYFAEDHCSNYRIALAYNCLDEEGTVVCPCPGFERTSGKGRRKHGQPFLRLRQNCVKS